MKYLICQIVYYFSIFSLENQVQNVFSIWRYASVSTQTSVLIIGGGSDKSRKLYRSSSIVEYNDDNWTVIGNIKQERVCHQAISIGSMLMIIGGISHHQEL